MTQLTGILITKKNEPRLSHALTSLRFCDEIIIVVDSANDTVFEETIKKEFPHAAIYFRKLGNDFSSQRNFGLEKTHTEWALFLDADEEIPENCQKKILHSVQNPDVHGYYIKREDFLWGKHIQYGEVKNIWLLRLARKTSGRWVGSVHETWNVTGKTSKLSSPFFHYPHPSISEFISKIDLYSTLRAEELHKDHVSSSFVSILLYTKAKFFYTYIIQQGFRDGIQGFLLSVCMSFHSFLVRSKLYLLNKN